jgi:hypothetical protein
MCRASSATVAVEGIGVVGGVDREVRAVGDRPEAVLDREGILPPQLPGIDPAREFDQDRYLHGTRGVEPDVGAQVGVAAGGRLEEGDRDEGVAARPQTLQSTRDVLRVQEDGQDEKQAPAHERTVDQGHQGLPGRGR